MSSQTNLATAIKEKSNCDSRVPSQCTEQACRQRISSQGKFFKMEASPLIVPKTLCEKGKVINRPLCFQGVSPAYIAWRRDPYSNKYIHAATNNFSITWKKEFHYTFPPFGLITRVLNKIEKDKTKKLILITPCWQTQSWYPQILSMLIRKPVIRPLSEKLIINPSGQTHPLAINQIFTLVAWMVSGDICLRKKFLSRQPILSPIQGDRVLYQVTSHSGRSGLAGVIEC